MAPPVLATYSVAGQSLARLLSGRPSPRTRGARGLGTAVATRLVMAAIEAFIVKI